MVKKVFVDCGGHQATSVKMFIEKYPQSSEYEIHSFEANWKYNDYFQPYIDSGRINYESAAVWIEDGTTSFYMMNNASSAISKFHGDESRRQFVKCFDFSKWLSDNFDREDFIVLKMDIEGAEYEVLQKMIDDGTIDMIDRLYIDLHQQSKKGIALETHLDVLEALVMKYDIKPYRWSAEKGSQTCFNLIDTSWRESMKLDSLTNSLGDRWKKIKNKLGITHLQTRKSYQEGVTSDEII